MSDRLMLVDDDDLLLDSLRYALEHSGYEVDTFTRAEDAAEAAERAAYALAIMDIRLPGMSGLELCHQLRERYDLPIIFLTARDRELDVILGLERGADDYVTKPFRTGELLARIGAVLRRTRPLRQSPITQRRLAIDDLTIDRDAHRVTLQGQEIELAPKEFALLWALASHAGKALSREQLLEIVWGSAYLSDPRVLDVHVRWLRQRIEKDPGHPKRIHTVRGVGYQYVLEEP